MSEISSAKIATDQIKERLLSKLDAQLVEVVDTSGRSTISRPLPVSPSVIVNTIIS